jgi:signal transduction histidine kinase
MAERAQRIGARLDVASAPGEGTIIRLEVGDG